MKNLLIKRNILSTLFFGFSLCNGQIINNFSGIGGIGGYGGDGGPATNANLFYPRSVASDALGNVYIADQNNNRVRKVNAAGIISTFAGTGTPGYNGDGGLAINAQLNAPEEVAVDALGNVYIAEWGNSVIRKVNTNGTISTIAGGGMVFPGDGGLATNALISAPEGIAVDVAGNLFFSDYVNNRIRKVNVSGIISTYAGTGAVGFSGDGGPAVNAQLNGPQGLAIDASGNLYIADGGNIRLRKINPSGIIFTIAGIGVLGFTGDGTAATSAQISYPNGVAVDSIGNVYFGDGNRIRKVNPSGVISTIAGTGTGGYSGDGASPINAQFNYPSGVNVDVFGNILVADRFNNRVREICTIACLVNIKKLTDKEGKILISPNPNKGLFDLQIDDDIINGTLILINSIGQKVYEQKIIQGSNDIIATGLPRGIYSCTLFQDKRQITSGRIIIE